MAARCGRGILPGSFEFFQEDAERLIAFAREEFRSALSGVGDVSAHLAAARRAGAKVEIEPPQPPAVFAHVYEWFLTLHAQRRPGFDGPAPLTLVDVDAFFRLEGVACAAHELRLLLEMDRAFMSEVARRRQHRQKRTGKR